MLIVAYILDFHHHHACDISARSFGLPTNYEWPISSAGLITFVPVCGSRGFILVAASHWVSVFAVLLMTPFGLCSPLVELTDRMIGKP